jgi:chemotaxis protein MotB
MIIRRLSQTKTQQSTFSTATRDFRPEVAGSLSSAQWANDDGNWMITLCDLTFVLIGFLVVWYVTGKEAATSISAQAKPATRKSVTAPAGTPLLPSRDLELLRNEIADYVASLALQSDVDLRSGTNEVVLSLRDTVSFDSGKADLRDRAFPLLEKVAAIAIAEGKLQVEIRGHTDDRPISTPEFPSNWELSAARASRVARYLIERGVHPSRIAVQGFASQRPRVSKTSGSRRSANRRVEIRLYQVPAF